MFQKYVQHKRQGGVPLTVGVSTSVWMGGLDGAKPHEPFVYLGPKDWEGEEELTFLAGHEAVEALVERLREAATQAFGPRRAAPSGD